MPANSERKYQRVISYIEDEVGADVNRDMLKVALSDQDITPLVVNTPAGEELRARLFGIDSQGNKEQVGVVPLDSDASVSSGAQITYLARALASNDLDEFITRVTNSAGSQVDPLTMDVTASVGNDELRIVTPNPIDVSASTVPVEQQTAIAVEDTTSTQIDPATQQTLAAIAAALSSNGTDSVLVDSNNVLDVSNSETSHEHRSETRTIKSSEVYTVAPNDEWFVDSLTVNGELYVEGTLTYYGTLDGTGSIKGSGTVISKE